MDNLPLSPNETPELWRTTSKELWSLLSGSSDAQHAAKMISSNPVMRIEVERIEESLRTSAQAAGVRPVAVLVTKLFIQFGLKDIPPAQKTELMEPYLEALSGLPLTCLEASVRAWNKAEPYPDQPGRCAFMPKPAELFALASSRAEKLRQAAYRAKVAITFRPQAARADKTPEEKAEVARMMAEFRGGLKTMGDDPRPTGSQHAMAERLRRAAESEK